MTRRFSPAELSFLRNQVPIGQVIETLLGPANPKSNGKMSFACPLCAGFNTAINAAHNLARCFACRQNFNPIELVMHQLKIDFVASVKWLKNRMQSAPAHQKTSSARGNNAQPTAIGDILSDLMPPLAESKNDVRSIESIVLRISRLEQHLSHLYRVVNKLQSSIDQ